MAQLRKIQKTVSGVIHLAKEYGSEKTGVVLGSACGAGENGYPWYEMPEDTKVTCKRCVKKLQRAEYLGLHLKVVDNEDGSSKVVDTREEVAPEPEAEAPAIDDHAAAVARIRANIDAEEEERAAARRARNRVNYAPAPTAQEDATITREPEDRTLTEVEEMEDQYQDLVHVCRGLRLLSDQFCRLLAEMKDGEGLDEDDARFRRIKRKLDRNLKLEGENLTAREALSMKIREARGQGRCLQRGAERGGFSLQCIRLRGHSGDCKNSRGETFTNWLDPQDVKEKPFHRQVKDAINLKW